MLEPVSAAAGLIIFGETLACRVFYLIGRFSEARERIKRLHATLQDTTDILALFDELQRENITGAFGQERIRHSFERAIEALRELFDRLDKLLNKYIPTHRHRKILWVMKGLGDAMVLREEIVRYYTSLSMTLAIVNATIGHENRQTLATIQKRQTTADGWSLRPSMSHENSQDTEVAHADQAGTIYSKPVMAPQVDSAIDMTSPTIPYEMSGGLGIQMMAQDKRADSAGMEDTLHHLRKVMDVVHDISVIQNRLANRTEAWLESVYQPDVSHICVEEAEAMDYPAVWPPLASWKALVLSLKLPIPPSRSTPMRRHLPRVIVAAPDSVFSDKATANTYEEQEAQDRNVMEEQLRIIFNFKETREVAPLDSRLTNFMASIADYAESILGEDVTAKSVVSGHWSSDASWSSSMFLEDSFVAKEERMNTAPVLKHLDSAASANKTSQRPLPPDDRSSLPPEKAQTDTEVRSTEPSLLAYLIVLCEALFLQSMWECIAMLQRAHAEVVGACYRATQRIFEAEKNVAGSDQTERVDRIAKVTEDRKHVSLEDVIETRH